MYRKKEICHCTPSCDTVAVEKSAAVSGCNILAKNSDRETDECQNLKFFPAEKHAPGEMVKCTYIEVPQAEQTYAMIGSQPWWIWGFEMGINEHGVCIGNEADWSEIPAQKEEALLGMDLLRLGLERGRTAYQAMHVIIDHLEKYGQGGGCAYMNPDDNYHNTFMISDSEAVWLLETVDRHWAAKRIKGIYPISNLYTIGEEYDECSEGLAEYAAANGLHDPKRPFDFSKSFVLLNTRTLSGYPRECRAHEIIRGFGNRKYTGEDMWTILRDHFEGSMLEPRWGAAATLAAGICMHGCEPGPCQSAASMVTEYRKPDFKMTKFVYWASMAPPCSSFAIPFFNVGYVPEAMGRGTNKYSGDSFWWKAKRLQVDVEADHPKYVQWIREERRYLDGLFHQASERALQAADMLLKQGNEKSAEELLKGCTDECFERANASMDMLIEKIEADIKENGTDVFRVKNHQAFIEKTGLPVPV